MRGILERTADAVTAVAAILAAAVAVALAGTLLCGGRIVTVLSGSMEPTYRTGSLLFVRPVDADTLRSGDVIAYMIAPRVMVTHRIVEVLRDDSGGLCFRTKGDANTAADELPVRGENVVGKPVLAVPYAGYAVNYVQQPPGLYAAAAAVVCILLAAFLPPLLTKKREEASQ